MGDPFKIVSVRRAETPAGADGSWHGYVISQGRNTIQGCRQGTLEAVTADVEQIVALLNARRIGKGGRVHLVMKPARNASTKHLD